MVAELYAGNVNEPDRATPAQRLALYRARFATKDRPPEDRSEASLSVDDLNILGELPQTPPDIKDALLVELRERLRRGRAGALAG